MPEAFDTGPLSWVKDEIDQSLKKVLTSFNTVKQNLAEFPALRFDLAHLYQVNGALDMVGLEGCKRYCAEIEKLTNKISQQLTPATEQVMTDLITAVETLTQYLQDLLNGMPDTPIKLFSTLKPIVEAQGETLDESELFFPDTDHSAPKDLPKNPIEESAIPIFVSEQRALFQKALLEWLRTKNADALLQMRDAISQVQQVQVKNAPRTLWWTASAFADSLAQAKVSDHLGAKKLCRKLDRQLGNLALGDAKAPSQLLRELLYYVAISDRVTDLIARVKDVFDLDDALPNDNLSGNETALSTASERAALAQFIADLPALKDLWSNISIASTTASADDLSSFVNKFEVMAQAAQQNVSNQNLVKLVQISAQAAKTLQSDAAKLNDTSFIELAAALNLLEHCCAHYQHLDAETKQKVATQAERLQALIDGVELMPALDDFASSKLDASVVNAVAKQIIDELAQVESALDTFFRNPANRAVLDDAAKPLQQVVAAFEMLDMATPKHIAAISALFVDLFKNDTTHDALGETYKQSFELVAESLSMLGLYAEELPNVRAESEQALADALKRMQQGADEVQLDVSAMTTADGSLSEIVSPAPVIEEAEPAETMMAFQAYQDDSSSIPSFLSTLDDIAATDADGLSVDRALDPELQDIFLTEAEEVLAGLAQNLQALRVNATDSEAINEVRRGYHTLKGSGRTVGLLAMGEVAWSVESLLNQMLERKVFATSAILSFIEKVTADFASWVAELFEKDRVSLNAAPYEQQSKQLLSELEQAQASKAKPQKEEVLIGGTRKLSKAFFEIFLAEAEQHLKTLLDAQDSIAKDSSASYRAAHTLGSNALTAGFKPIGDLARALEHWLDEHAGSWTAQHIALYGNVVKALAEGLESVKALNEPKTTRAFIAALAESTAAMQAAATVQAEAAVIEAEKTAQATKKPSIKVVVTKGVSDQKKVGAAIVPPVIKVEPQQAIEPPVLQAIEAEAVKAPEPKVPESKVEQASIAAEQVALRKDNVVNEELLALFLEEARELVPQIGKDLRGWRGNPQDAEYVDSLQRVLHTLKGSARMAGLAGIGDSVHGMEDYVIRALNHKVTNQDFDTMFLEFDQISFMLEQVAGAKGAVVATDATGEAVVAPARRAERKSQFLRMRADVLDRLINEAGEVSIMRSRMDREMQDFKQSSLDLTDSISRLRAYLRELEIEAETQLQSRMNLLQEANEAFDPLEFDRFTRLQELTRMMAESVNDVSTIQHTLLLNLDQTDAALQQQNRMNRELQQGLMRVRMLPFATISERLQRIVRQTARELNKQVEMRIDGEGIELDRGVLDKLGAPLEHLLRNAVAHGLESTEQRLKAGKTEVGHINLRVNLENDEITLVITDDGAGVNLAKVKQKAIEKGMLVADQEITEQALMSIIFEPGFSTADAISQIAGRGVGLDAVRSDIAALGGRIDVNNVVGAGAMFNIYLPVTLSVAQVVLVRAGHKVFAIPTVMIEQVQKLKPSVLESAYQAGKVDWAGREYPLHFLSKLVGENDYIPQSHIYTPVILMRSGAYRTALHVDEVIGNQEVVMKPMGTQLSYVPGMIGASVLGDGAIVLVINAVQLANRELLAAGAIRATVETPVIEDVRKIVLVVDDSLTMRKVLSRVLEREDYEVVTANDGVDAIQLLQEITPDIILTDIEMPRMDGFEFSRFVRDNPATANTPLVVISSRTADKHRNVAKEIGVNAFLGKPVQDDELIEQVRALIKK
ncbi:MAG: chemotaxis protein CheA [Methylotenera sp. 24-45-7]|jgi:chemosensory pili system protein ChpA (sensor histidine kinase/response regulator)|nr:MAG: chemotaxis protein CheA [Methylotenera sp. 24-45-7]OZA09855.1 MAG: chemotaxis protein CheA [Methylotenera sp. 17-45-7]HQS43747.1 Hpt domain-containing protein [Methylotenera sp.]